MKFPTLKQLSEKVSIECYGEVETMTREQALDKYRMCIDYSDGSEKERYVNIFLQLLDGYRICYDN